MIFKINRNELLKGIDIVKRSIDVSNPVPTLTGIAFEVSADYLDIIGTNKIYSLKYRIHKQENVLSINKLGRILFQTKYLSELIRKIDSNVIQFEAHDESIVKIYASKSEYELKPLKYASFPIIKFHEDKKGTELPTNLVKDIYNFVKGTADSTNQRLVLTGVNIILKGNTIKAQATDSYRLATYIDKVESQSEFDINIPNVVLKELAAIIEPDKSVFIDVVNKKIIVNSDNVSLVGNSIDAKYPDLKDLIPSSFRTVFGINRKKFISALERIITLSEIDFNQVSISIEKDKMILSNNTSHIGGAHEELPIKCEKHEKELLTINSLLLLAALKAFTTNEVALRIQDKNKPIIIDASGKSFQLVLPFRT